MTFPFYIEGIMFGFLIDVLYGPGVGSLLREFKFALGASVMILLSIPIRDYLRLDYA